MPAIEPCSVPSDALLKRYLNSGGYVDCYAAQFASPASFEDYVAAFYTTPLFKLERLILRVTANRPSTDAEAVKLARGERDTFAAWSVEARTSDQLLLADFTGRTKSWLKIAPRSGGGAQLYFGSAVVPVRDPKTGRMTLGPVFSALLGFHKLYSRMLLSAATRRLSRNSSSNARLHRS